MSNPFVKQESSPISSEVAWYGSLVGPVLYVAPFYLSHTLKTSDILSRDDPRIIRARVRAVAGTCIVCAGLAFLLLTVHGGLSIATTLRYLAISPLNPVDILRTVLSTAILFIGPLYEQIFVDRVHRNWNWNALRQNLWDSWTGYRNLVVAPISEEIVFRSFVIALYLAASRPASEIIFCSPLVFGVAHLHHLVDFLRSHTAPGERGPPFKFWMIGIIRSLVQFTYTSLFGFFAAFVYLRTGNVLACIAAHVFCNWQGVPRVWGRVGAFDHSASSTQIDVTHDVATSMPMSDISNRQGSSIAPTVIYYLLLVVGAYAFAATLWPLTESTNSLMIW